MYATYNRLILAKLMTTIACFKNVIISSEKLATEKASDRKSKKISYNRKKTQKK